MWQTDNDLGSDSEFHQNWCKKRMLLLCAFCLWAGVAVSETGFQAVVHNDRALNDLSTDSVNFIFTTSTGTVATGVSIGDHMIDVESLHKIRHPT